MFVAPFLESLNMATQLRAEQIMLYHNKDMFPENKYTFYFEGKVQSVDRIGETSTDQKLYTICYITSFLK